MTNDGLGDRCKEFEMIEAGRRAVPGLPLLARLDGRAFHAFTRGLKRPYDTRLSFCMAETAAYLVEKNQPAFGYTQSDEITLAWYEGPEQNSEYLFGGRFQKLASVLAGMASARFTKLVAEKLPEKAEAVPHFDCRVWQVPSLQAAVDVLIWREDDATKNSISMLAASYYSHNQLQNKNSAEKRAMLMQKGINWNNQPDFFKRGSYVRRHTITRQLSEKELSRIPEQHRPAPGTEVKRSCVAELYLPSIRQLSNPIDVLFYGAAPTLKE